ALPRERFDAKLIEELKSEAAANVEFEDDTIVLKHVYIERRMQPLNLYYDEIAEMLECNFRRIPPPRSAGEPHYAIGPHDVFPEQYVRFLVSDPRAREIFLERHADLMKPEFWAGKQERLRAGVQEDVFPYAASARFSR